MRSTKVPSKYQSRFGTRQELVPKFHHPIGVELLVTNGTLKARKKAYKVNKQWLTLRWGGYDYDIEMRRIPTPLALLEWLHQVLGKSWEFDTWEVAEMIREVCAIKGWDLFGSH